MSWHDDYLEYEREAGMDQFLNDELRQISEGPVIYYLATYGDAIEKRVRGCIEQGKAMNEAGTPVQHSFELRQE